MTTPCTVLLGFAALFGTSVAQERTKSLPVGPLRSEVCVVLKIDAAEVGPSACPAKLVALLAGLDAPRASERSRTRKRLSRLNWRHLSWLAHEQHKGSAERRLALAWVVRRLRDRRYEGQAARPLEAAFER